MVWCESADGYVAGDTAGRSAVAIGKRNGILRPPPDCLNRDHGDSGSGFVRSLYEMRQ
jgi:hypothetical protein